MAQSEEPVLHEDAYASVEDVPATDTDLVATASGELAEADVLPAYREGLRHLFAGDVGKIHQVVGCIYQHITSGTETYENQAQFVTGLSLRAHALLVPLFELSRENPAEEAPRAPCVAPSEEVLPVRGATLFVVGVLTTRMHPFLAAVMHGAAVACEKNLQTCVVLALILCTSFDDRAYSTLFAVTLLTTRFLRINLPITSNPIT